MPLRTLCKLPRTAKESAKAVLPCTPPRQAPSAGTAKSNTRSRLVPPPVLTLRHTMCVAHGPSGTDAVLCRYQCMTTTKSVAAVIVAGGVLTYSLGPFPTLDPRP
eukprot:2163259-Rhodomonas_salina.1